MINPISKNYLKSEQILEITNPEQNPRLFEYFEFRDLLYCRQIDQPDRIFVFHPTANLKWEWEPRKNIPTYFGSNPSPIPFESVYNKLEEITSRRTAHPQVTPSKFSYYSCHGRVYSEQKDDQATVYYWSKELRNWELMPRIPLEFLLGHNFFPITFRTAQEIIAH